MKIRYHHLMCTERFRGNGYSKEFCDNMTEIIKSIKENNYELVDCCDDICKVCPNNIGGRCKDEEKVSKYDNAVKAALKKGITPLPKDICSDCQWYYICKNI